VRVTVTGAGGFIGHHLVNALKDQKHFVRGVDIKEPEFAPTQADEFLLLDLRASHNCDIAARNADQVFALAADMGGMGYITFNDADILHNNTLITVNTLEAARQAHASSIIYASSACIYPNYLQEDADVIPLAEDMSHPADPQHGYGWEKLVGEKIYMAYQEAGYIDTRIARLHNVYGPLGTWDGGREKAPAAIARKVAQARAKDSIEIWGDGEQTRSFCYINDCIDGLLKLSQSSYTQPLNIGSSDLISINEMADILIGLSGKKLTKKYVDGPEGVRGRNSDNTLCQSVLGWEPVTAPEEGLAVTYSWIKSQVEANAH
jgi:GDP-D-mannose 3', 5'-epimerase